MRNLLILCLPAVAAAAIPVATVSSSADFSLGRAQIQVRGVPDWPLVSGDEITVGIAPALVTFKDGSRAFLNTGARARLDVTGKQPVLRLLNGDLAYKLERSSRVGIAGLAFDSLPGESREGLLSVAGAGADWAPLDPAAFATPGRDANSFRYRIRPWNVGFLDRWRSYNPPFGFPPNFVPPGPPPGVPPTPPGPPSGLPPVSINKP